jgi:hypothetical protein
MELSRKVAVVDGKYSNVLTTTNKQKTQNKWSHSSQSKRSAVPNSNIRSITAHFLQ